MPEFEREGNIILIPNKLACLFLVNGSSRMSANQNMSDIVALMTCLVFFHFLDYRQGCLLFSC